MKHLDKLILQCKQRELDVDDTVKTIQSVFIYTEETIRKRYLTD